MAQLPEKKAEIIWHFQRQLLEIIDRAKTYELMLALPYLW
jgi:hypothetical protein